MLIYTMFNIYLPAIHITDNFYGGLHYEVIFNDMQNNLTNVRHVYSINILTQSFPTCD